ELRAQQLAKISELDSLVMDARAKHSQCVHDLKLNFNKEKAEYKQNARKMVKQLEKDANKVSKEGFGTSNSKMTLK
ncbi:hypothetical protein scyTo_0025221, partial [Scyliorhinus torazame]|nr:hypothetical protein [Scyliorhinus torazame]